MNSNFEEILSVVSGSSNVLGDMSVPTFLLLLIVSLLSSFLIAYFYLFFYQNKATGTQVYRAFPLLGVSITSIFICIQFSLALSLGLLGALSIVRFRTPIKEPEEIGFIMLIIAASIATATFNLIFLGLLLSVSLVALIFIRYFLRGFSVQRTDGLIILTVHQDDFSNHAENIDKSLQKLVRNPQTESVTRHGENTIVTYRFSGLAQHSLAAIQSSISDSFPLVDFKLYFHRPGIS